MFQKDKSVRDGFTFSLGGTTVINSVVAAPAIASDHLNRQIAAHIERSRIDATAKRNAWCGQGRVPA